LRIEVEKIDRSLGLLGVLVEPTTVVMKAWEQVRAVGNAEGWAEPSPVKRGYRNVAQIERRSQVQILMHLRITVNQS
jgi:hypothetical protein